MKSFKLGLTGFLVDELFYFLDFHLVWKNNL